MLAGVLRVEQFSDAEVEQLRHTFPRHEDVRGLEVAVDDEVLVSVIDTPADFDEQFQPLPGRQITFGAVVINLDAFDVLHHEERLAVGRDAAVQEARDVRVVERGEDLPLAAETAGEVGVGETAPHELERDLLLKLSVRALGEEDRAHPAAAQLAQNPVGPELPVLQLLVRQARDQVGGEDEGRGFDEMLRRRRVYEQRFDFAAQLGVAGAGAVEQRAALRRLAFERGL
ncbi:MAG TPA: hypothetical protein VJZ91_19255 [Blastocatellia bacterium]|nr:hypothetical protein [Blastocatellia bacterium]